MNKICCTCKKDLDIDNFNFKNREKNIRAKECKQCHKEYNRAWFLKNREKRVAQIISKKNIVSERVKEYKSKLFCKECKEDDIRVLDFHHRNSGEKEHTVGQMAHIGFSFKRIMEEIDKCDVLISNCQRKLHYDEIGKHTKK